MKLTEEGAEHHDLALGKIDHFGRLVDQDESKGDQPIDAPDAMPPTNC